MKLKTALFSTAIALAGLFTTALPLAAISALTACDNGNTAGTDEQANSITAAIDSALTIWLASDTLIATEISSYPCIDCPHDIIQVPKIHAENGYLYLAGRIKDGTFGEIIEDWKWMAEAFEADCEEEAGAFEADTTVTIKGQHSFYCSLTNLDDETSSADRTKYVDAYWKKYVELVIGICRE